MKKLEILLESLLFGSRWLLAPFFFGGSSTFHVDSRIFPAGLAIR